jgi:hypothetical protein
MIMIPPIIHQTWKDDRIPDDLAAYGRSWNQFNPSWRRILWTDRMLLDFVEQDYPDLLELYCSYSNGVCRADAARYMLLHKFGGLYADIDVECLAPLESLENESRVVLCQEPPSHWPLHAPYRGHPFILFNGVMASPAGHPFWQNVLDRMPETRNATEILDMTGPCMLTGHYLGFEQKDSVVVHSCHLFTPTDRSQQESPPYGEHVPASLTRHYWHGTWIERDRPRKRILKSLTTSYHRLRYRLTRGAVLDPGDARRRVDPKVLDQSPPAGNRLAILVPVRDAAAHLDAFVEAISATDLPKEKTKLVFCEGDSVDGTRDKLNAIAPNLRKIFRDVVLLNKTVGTRFKRGRRWDRGIQRARRAGIAAVRNHLIDHGLDETDDWALWIDVDVWRIPVDIFQSLRSTGARIAVPNCVVVPGGSTYDSNSFVSIWNHPKSFYYRYVRSGLFQPPPRARGRLYLDCVRHSERVELDGVGGTTLLVDASLHRAGLRFPEIPYKDLIETEAFGVLARDIGVRAVGLPRVEVVHVPY